MHQERFVMACDVGTSSVRTALINLRNGSIKPNSLITDCSIELFTHPVTMHMEQSSINIWKQICNSCKKSLQCSNTSPEQVVGVCFDATCSLVVWDVEKNKPISVSLCNEFNHATNEEDVRNIILWADHRSKKQAEEINSTKHEVLKYVGGKMSPEMEMPKIKWLIDNQLINLENEAVHFFDLADWLTYKCTGELSIRSQCTTTCKWGFVFDDSSNRKEIICNGWNIEFLKSIGLEQLVQPTNRIGSNICEIGRNISYPLTKQSAQELGLLESIPVAIPVIDAHAGGIGMIGAVFNMNENNTKDDLCRTIVIIAGTSSCHMAASTTPIFIDGVWGCYRNAMVQDMYLNEGGQSFVGALIDYVVESHPKYFDLVKLVYEETKELNISNLKKKVYQKLDDILELLREQRNLKCVDILTRDIHILPHFNGCRSPLADPNMRGIISGLQTLPLNTNEHIYELIHGTATLVLAPQLADFEPLALLYLSTIQSLAYGTRHIIDEMVKKGYNINNVFMCGGLSNNELFVRQHSNATNLPIYRMDGDSMLLGCGVLSAVACQEYSNMFEAMKHMCHLNRNKDVIPQHDTQEYHQKKYNVYLKMNNDFIEYREMMK
ncbi:hypothetical protein C9374_001745 [Naegleria lovaniensis]|uniref:FGGY carbohydrate kinase domain-containing protein n=1 Tax=Naegleria lovaniensis TaxID=51637 RepID=A0AA88KMA8_NAELO|nr:uncharacterized protein C9374_001745 [Naegleria lovaniensis]KAG2387413.1 hypothetical protein C9374_001745 [Naegleria lovaniensis]